MPGNFVGLPDDGAEQVALNFAALSNREGETVPESVAAQSTLESGEATYATAG